MSLDVLPFIKHSRITRSYVYEEYINNYIKREVKKLDMQPKEKEIIEKMYFADYANGYLGFYGKLAQNYAKLLHKEGAIIINHKSKLFEELNYNHNLSYKSQIISWVLKGLPLTVTVNGKAPNEDITVKFSHDTIKNFFLIKKI